MRAFCSQFNTRFARWLVLLARFASPSPTCIDICLDVRAMIDLHVLDINIECCAVHLNSVILTLCKMLQSYPWNELRLPLTFPCLKLTFRGGGPTNYRQSFHGHKL